MITQERLKECLRYDYESGDFYWLKNTRGHYLKGKKAGCGRNGYIVIGLDGKSYYAHRLAWLYINGEMLKQIDHIDGNRSNNKIENLRDVSHSENCHNKAKSRNNKTGVIGVHWNSKEQKFKAQINVDGKRIHLGYHDHLFSAVCARKSAELKYNYHPNHGTR